MQCKLPAPLDYLFTAELADGTRLHQDRHDRSREHPLTRSAFYDVLQRVAEVRRFALRSRDGRHLHLVDLTDGHFETDGQVICSPYGELTNYRVIYFRRCQQIMEGCTLIPPRIVGYFLGWQANDGLGRNQQMTLEIPPLGLGAARVERKK
jgi:hypothetical protein